MPRLPSCQRADDQRKRAYPPHLSSRVTASRFCGERERGTPRMEVVTMPIQGVLSKDFKFAILNFKFKNCVTVTFSPSIPCPLPTRSIPRFKGFSSNRPKGCYSDETTRLWGAELRGISLHQRRKVFSDLGWRQSQQWARFRAPTSERLLLNQQPTPTTGCHSHNHFSKNVSSLPLRAASLCLRSPYINN